MQETITDFTVFYYHTIIQKKAKALNKNQKSKICKSTKQEPKIENMQKEETSQFPL